MLVMTSCGKEDKIRNRMAGVWQVTSVEAEYLPDVIVYSTASYLNIVTWVLKDAGLMPYNPYHMVHDGEVPRSIRNYCTATQLSSADSWSDWYPDKDSEDRFTIWALTGIGFTEYYLIYTILQTKKNKMVLQYIENHPGDPSQVGYREILTLERN